MITVGKATSNVKAVDGSELLTDEMKEQIIRLTVARVKEELRAEEESRRAGEVRDRRSETDY
jgi:hypothetical protein